MFHAFATMGVLVMIVTVSRRLQSVRSCLYPMMSLQLSDQPRAIRLPTGQTLLSRDLGLASTQSGTPTAGLSMSACLAGASLKRRQLCALHSAGEPYQRTPKRRSILRLCGRPPRAANPVSARHHGDQFRPAPDGCVRSSVHPRKPSVSLPNGRGRRNGLSHRGDNQGRRLGMWPPAAESPKATMRSFIRARCIKRLLSSSDAEWPLYGPTEAAGGRLASPPFSSPPATRGHGREACIPPPQDFVHRRGQKLRRRDKTSLMTTSAPRCPKSLLER